MLVLLGLMDTFLGPIHIGVLAVIPLMLIGFFGNRWLAVVTAIICAAGFAALDNDVVRPLVQVHWNMQADAALFTIIFVAVLMTAERLRVSEFAAGADVLTSLANRRTLQHRIDEALDRARESQAHVALLFVDLDHFKDVNDRYGHSVGDRVLQYVSERLVHAVRAMDTVGRVGGDEFVVLLEDVIDRSHAERIASTIETVLSEPFRENGTVQTIGATVGVSTYPEDASDGASLIRAADARMYDRKREKARSAIQGSTGLSSSARN